METVNLYLNNKENQSKFRANSSKLFPAICGFCPGCVMTTLEKTLGITFSDPANIVGGSVRKEQPSGHVQPAPQRRKDEFEDSNFNNGDPWTNTLSEEPSVASSSNFPQVTEPQALSRVGAKSVTFHPQRPPVERQREQPTAGEKLPVAETKTDKDKEKKENDLPCLSSGRSRQPKQSSKPDYEANCVICKEHCTVSGFVRKNPLCYKCNENRRRIVKGEETSDVSAGDRRKLRQIIQEQENHREASRERRRATSLTRKGEEA